jgi:3D-(3,5/4)-trihydroxycyclohexane-1,2-dione acylhydrolase (decyclizing)
MNPTELVTASKEGLKITLIVSENHVFQGIRGLQLNRAGHSFGNEFRVRNPKTQRLDGDFVKVDFAANAESMGARAWRVKTPEEFRQALRESRAETRACIIVAETEKYHFPPGSGVWWDVAVAEVSQDPVTRKLREEYVATRNRLQRFHY